MEKIKLNIQMFASTNKTANYDLSQYVGADKPTYLGDYNSDMLKIDTQMKKNADDIASVDSKATTTQETATQAQATATNAQETATQAQSTATNALNKSIENESELNKFNLNIFLKYTDISNLEFSDCTVTDYYVTLAKNNDNSIIKFYGQINLDNVAQGGIPKVTLNVDTGLRPTEDIYIADAGFINFHSNPINSENIIQSTGYTIKPDGKLVFNLAVNFTGNTSKAKAIFFPCLIFVKNFGDTPTE